MCGVSSTQTKTEPVINQSLGYTETDRLVAVSIDFQLMIMTRGFSPLLLSLSRILDFTV